MTQLTKEAVREAAIKALDDRLAEVETDENGLLEDNKVKKIKLEIEF